MSRRVRLKLSSLTSNTSLDNKLVFKRLKVELYLYRIYISEYTITEYVQSFVVITSWKLLSKTKILRLLTTYKHYKWGQNN